LPKEPSCCSDGKKGILQRELIWTTTKAFENMTTTLARLCTTEDSKEGYQCLFRKKGNLYGRKGK
jgi:hypothetical protein